MREYTRQEQEAAAVAAKLIAAEGSHLGTRLSRCPALGGDPPRPQSHCE